MKIARTAILATLLSSLTAVTAFQTVPRSSVSGPSPVVGHRSTTAVSSTANAEAPCAGTNDVIPESVTAQSLRTAILTNIDGDLIRLDEKMGKGTSIVVFLRHLG